MTSRELVVRTLNHEPVPRVPRDLWIRLGEDHVQPDELAEMHVRYPSDIVTVDAALHGGRRSQQKAGKAGDSTDAWGCVWHISDPGVAPVLKQSPLTDLAKMAAFKPPAAVLDSARFAKANKCCATSRFVLAWSEVRPLDRLRTLCGETALVQLARGKEPIRKLLAALHDLNCKELERWGDTEVDGVAIRDDWGTPEGLLVSPEMWRDVFRPLYREYCNILHAKDKFVFFHSDGNIQDIFSDLVKLGFDAVHCDWDLMNPGRMAKRFCGRVTFWGGTGQRPLREPGTPDQFRDSVLAGRRLLDFGAGGVIAQCQWDPGIRLQTIATFFELWLAPLPMHAS
ncbi:MAG: uroporphyrinogen decarboxylase family protein [Thermoguttaceae bacterium]